jgi:hypothetical protein
VTITIGDAEQWLNPVRSLWRRGILLRSHASIFGLRISLLLRIGWLCLIVAELEDDYLHPLAAELFGFRITGHVDIDMVAVHLSTGVFYGIYSPEYRPAP